MEWGGGPVSVVSGGKETRGGGGRRERSWTRRDLICTLSRGGIGGIRGAFVSRARPPIACRAGSDVFPGSWRVRTLAATLAWALMPVDILEESLA